jgi:hypothetical protein
MPYHKINKIYSNLFNIKKYKGASMNEIIDLLTADQLARNKGDNSIPHLKIGKYIRFSESDVRLWLHSKQKNTIACE